MFSWVRYAVLLLWFGCTLERKLLFCAESGHLRGTPGQADLQSSDAERVTRPGKHWFAWLSGSEQLLLLTTSIILWQEKDVQLLQPIVLVAFSSFASMVWARQHCGSSVTWPRLTHLKLTPILNDTRNIVWARQAQSSPLIMHCHGFSPSRALQVVLPVMRFRDGKPHYLWLPLSRRNERDTVSGSLHLRLQWSSEEADNPSDSSKTLMVEIALKGIGISFVEASVLKLPREVWRSELLLCGLQLTGK